MNAGNSGRPSTHKPSGNFCSNIICCTSRVLAEPGGPKTNTLPRVDSPTDMFCVVLNWRLGLFKLLEIKNRLELRVDFTCMFLTVTSSVPFLYICSAQETCGPLSFQHVDKGFLGTALKYATRTTTLAGTNRSSRKILIATLAP